MKRFVLLLFCAALCLCVLAAPASAKRKSPLQQPYRPDTAPQYVWGPWWWEYSGVNGTAADVSWWWCETPPPDDPDPFWDEFYLPVDNDRPILKTEFTLGVGYGLIRHIPNIILATYDVTGVEGDAVGFSAHYSEDEVKAYWTRPFVWDEFWCGWWDALFHDGWIPGPFNPSIGAAIYGTYLQFPLFPAGEAPKTGTYHVVMSYRQALPWNEMLYWGDPSLPTHAPAGGEWGEEFYMEVVE